MIKCVPINSQILEDMEVGYASHQTASAKYVLEHFGLYTLVHLHVGHHVQIHVN